MERNPPCQECGQPMIVFTGRTKYFGELKRSGVCLFCEGPLIPLPIEDEQTELEAQPAKVDIGES